MQNVLKRMKNNFCEFYFSSYGQFWTFCSPIFDEFLTMNFFFANHEKKKPNPRLHHGVPTKGPPKTHTH